ncbi:MAG TPA: MgtC/SapB family protein [Holophagaceae bacterium]|nr:MgtC/SapB family protein [Holophagaceae bacterium]
MPPTFHHLPPEAPQILLVLFLSFLLGLDREEHKAHAGTYAFGGVRTFPLVGFLGFGLAFVSPGQFLLVAAGLAALGGLMAVSYSHKLKSGEAGLTTELTGLCTFAVGALIANGHYWTGIALVVFTLLLLELKAMLEGLAVRMAPNEVATFTKFLLLAAVILPIVPNEAFTPFELNPFKTWLVVVTVCAVSYAGYGLEKVTKGRGGTFLSALLGGAYSSTVTTVVLAKRSAQEHEPDRFAGGIWAASGVMYLRLAALVFLFNGALGRMLAPSLCVLGLIALVAGWLLSRRGDSGLLGSTPPESRNPLDLKAAFLFASVFLAITVITRLAVAHLGHKGLYGLAALMGVSDVDPFIMSLTQTAGGATPLRDAAIGVLVAAASNNVVKGLYARSFADRATGSRALIGLCALAALGVAAVALV